MGTLMHNILKTAAVLVMLGTAACGSIPEKELASYTTAFGQARSAGEAIVLDFEAAKAEQERREAARRPPTAQVVATTNIPLIYNPPQAGGATASAVRVRLLAWETIEQYNAVLAALNAGESVDEVKSASGRLFEVGSKLAAAAGSAFPGGGAVVTAAQELAAQLERMRLAAEFKRAVAGGAPIIRKILQVFRDDTRDHYTLRATLAEADFGRVRFENDLSDRDKEAKRARIRASIDELRKSLDSYISLLAEVDRALGQLQAAADKPIDFTAEAGRLLDLTMDLRQQWAAYQSVQK